MTQSWYLVQFKPNCHRIAIRNLDRQGFRTFLPLQEITRRRDARFVSELRPLFPGYMFLLLDPDVSPWRKVNSTYGVAKIVSFGEAPAPVPTELVSALFTRCDDDGRLVTSTTLKTGDEVTVVDGPFSDFAGTIETVDAQQRVWLLLEFMGQSARIQVDGSQVVPR